MVDDGSTDNTAEVVRQGYPQVKLLVQENAGPQAARNRAAHAASGQFLTLLDADDEWAPEKTERQLDLMVNNPQVGVVATNGIVRCGSLTHPWASPKVPRIYEFSDYQIAHRREPVGASVMFRTEAFERVGGWDESLPAAETVDVIFRMMASGYRFLYLNEPLYIIHRKPQSRGQRGSAVRVKGKLAVLSKLDPGRRPAGRPPRIMAHK